MSVIKPPRIYFQGFMEWDPNTCNNNKWLMQWNVDTSELNWSLLNKEGINWTNFRKEFPLWASKVSEYGSYPCQDKEMCPGEQPALWDYFGGNGCDFVNNDKASTVITGGILPDGKNQFPDALIGTPISLKGNPFNGHPTQARLVDLDAASTMTSQIWFDSLQLGDDVDPVFTGDRLDIMQSRFINGSRNLTYHQQAGSVGCIWQCTIPNSKLKFDSTMLSLSPLLKSVADGAEQGKGIMLRFCTYLTLYYKNGIYNDIEIQPRTAVEIEAMYEKVFAGELPIFSNPAYSRTVGSIGVWQPEDMQNAAAERTLLAATAVNYPTPPTPQVTNEAVCPSTDRIHSLHTMSRVADDQLSVKLGPALCEFSFDQNGNTSMAHLDLGSTFPEIDEKHPLAPPKQDFGSFELGVYNGSQYSALARIDYAQYEENTYIANAGMLDIATQPVSQSLVENGELAIRPISGSQMGKPALVESVNRIQTDSRGVYIDQGQSSEPILVRFQLRGKPAANKQLTVVRYVADPSIQHTAECDLSKPMLPVTLSDPQTITFTASTSISIKPVDKSESKAEVAVISTDPTGNASLSVTAGVPGYTYLAFFAGDIASVPANYSGGDVLRGEYAVVRVMPFDEGIQQEFVNVWNGVGVANKYDPDLVWEFIYNKILYFYDMIYPVMQRYVPLGDKKRMEGAVDQLQVTLSDAYMHDYSTMMMPITRDLSSAKRWVLLTWCELVKSNYQPVDLPPYKDKGSQT